MRGRPLVWVALLFAFGTSPCAHAQLTLSQGDSYVYEFRDLQFQGTGPVAQPRGNVSINLDPNAPRTGMLRIELYENSPSDTPVFMRSQDVSGFPSFEGGLDLATTLNLWADRQGAFRLFMESGTATINDFRVFRILPPTSGGIDVVDFYWNDVVPVPEPCASVLLAVGGLALFWFRTHRHRQVKTTKDGITDAPF
jgi:hypothetical protein